MQTKSNGSNFLTLGAGVKKLKWGLSYKRPHLFEPGRMPDQQTTKYPTQLNTIKRIRSFNVNTGSFGVFYCPLVETFAPYFADPNVVGSASYLPTSANPNLITYADTKGNDIPVNNGFIVGLDEWGEFNAPNRSFSLYTKLRLIGAVLEIEILDKEDNYQGFIEVAMGVKVATSDLEDEKIPADFSKLPEHVVVKPTKKIYCYFRITHKQFTQFGPYEPDITLPFFLIKGRGLSNTATVSIKTTTHMEGVVFHNSTTAANIFRQYQFNFDVQAKCLEIASLPLVETEDALPRGKNAQKNPSTSTRANPDRPIEEKNHKEGAAAIAAEAMARSGYLSKRNVEHFMNSSNQNLSTRFDQSHLAGSTLLDVIVSDLGAAVKFTPMIADRYITVYRMLLEYYDQLSRIPHVTPTIKKMLIHHLYHEFVIKKRGIVSASTPERIDLIPLDQILQDIWNIHRITLKHGRKFTPFLPSIPHEQEESNAFHKDEKLFIKGASHAYTEEPGLSELLGRSQP